MHVRTPHHQTAIARAACVTPLLAMFLLAPALPAQTQAKNQASEADTVIVPPSEAEPAEAAAARKDAAESLQHITAALKTAGLIGLNHIALIDAAVDDDGCQAPPLRTDSTGEGHSPSVDALANLLRARGLTVTFLSGAEIAAADLADQKRIQAIKNSFSLAYDQGPGRWFTTREELQACASGAPRPDAWKHPHAALAHVMATLHQDAVLAVQQGASDSKGANWNIMEQELSSTGKSFDEPVSSATVSATLILKDGTEPWSGEASAQGKLQPAAGKAATDKLASYMNSMLAKFDAWRKAHPDGTPPPDLKDDRKMNAIASGDLEAAPQGAAIGPSIAATQKAAAQRLFDQIAPALAPK